MSDTMDEKQKLTAELAARFLVARIGKDGGTRDKAYAYQCLALAQVIVDGVTVERK